MTCILVLGQHRSGTSLVSRILHESGVDMNPTSGEETWEDKKLQILHERAIGSWMWPHNVFEKVAIQYDREIQARANGILWGYKDPRLVYILPEVMAIIHSYDPHIRIVACERKIESSVRSLAEANPGLHFGAARNITSLYVNQKERALSAIAAPRLFVDYDRLVDNSEAVIKFLCRFVGSSYKKELVDIVDPEMRHF